VITNPTPQKQLRAPRRPRPTPRVAASGEHHAQLTRRITERDRWIARLLHEYRVLTTTQIAELAFPSYHAAATRLLRLYQWRVADRFQPLASASAEFHYVLDIAGATLLAHEDGIDPRDTGYRHDRAIGIAYSLRLAHTVTVNGFFTALVAAARRQGAAGHLGTWWPEHRCRRYFGDIVRPDAYGRWHDRHGEIEFFLELDWGTEPLAKVTRKLSGYARLADVTRITTPVLFAFPTLRRETSARNALHAAYAQLPHPEAVPAATGTYTAGCADPATEPSWLPLTHPHQRVRLSNLARIWALAPRTVNRDSDSLASTTTLRPPSPMPAADAAPHPRR
jgi:hypothetical protein